MELGCVYGRELGCVCEFQRVCVCFGCGECSTDLVSDRVLDTGHQDTGQVTDHRVLILPVVVVLDHLLIVLSLCTYSHSTNLHRGSMYTHNYYHNVGI